MGDAENTETTGLPEQETVAPLGRSGGRIVVGVDGSESSIEALRYGVQIASAFGAPLEAVTIWRFQYASHVPMADALDPENDARGIMESALGRIFGDQRPSWFTSHTSEGLTAETLIRESEGAGMLILGSRGHGGFVGLLLGSVSAQCAEHASCPVLVVHGPYAPIGKSGT